MKTANEGVVTLFGTSAERSSFRLPGGIQQRLFRWRETDTNKVYVSTGKRWFEDTQLSATASAFSVAVGDGRGYSASTSVTIPAGAEYSVKIEHNSNAVVWFSRANGINLEYYDGDVAGDLIQLAALRSLNELGNSGFEALLSIYDQHPTGERLVNNANSIDDAWYINGGAVIELSNDTTEDKDIIFSVGMEDIGTPVIPFGLLGSTSIAADTEMSDYNGAN